MQHTEDRMSQPDPSKGAKGFAIVLGIILWIVLVLIFITNPQCFRIDDWVN